MLHFPLYVRAIIIGPPPISPPPGVRITTRLNHDTMHAELAAQVYLHPFAWQE